MGEAKRRGTIEERRAGAIAAVRREWAREVIADTDALLSEIHARAKAGPLPGGMTVPEFTLVAVRIAAGPGSFVDDDEDDEDDDLESISGEDDDELLESLDDLDGSDESDETEHLEDAAPARPAFSLVTPPAPAPKNPLLGE